MVKLRIGRIFPEEKNLASTSFWNIRGGDGELLRNIKGEIVPAIISFPVIARLLEESLPDKEELNKTEILAALQKIGFLEIFGIRPGNLSNILNNLSRMRLLKKKGYHYSLTDEAKKWWQKQKSLLAQ